MKRVSELAECNLKLMGDMMNGYSKFIRVLPVRQYDLLDVTNLINILL
jgi:hypothetical protein